MVRSTKNAAAAESIRREAIDGYYILTNSNALLPSAATIGARKRIRSTLRSIQEAFAKISEQCIDSLCPTQFATNTNHSMHR